MLCDSGQGMVIRGAVLAWFSVIGCALTAAEPGSIVELDPWRDAKGQPIQVDQWKTGPIVITFLGTECPLAKQYAVKLEKYYQAWKTRGVQVIGVMSNVQDSPSEVTAFIKKLEISYPIAVDPGAKVADQFGAERTPEVFVLDGEHRLRYRGRIDDQFNVGTSRGEATSEDLRYAVEELLEGKAVSTPRTEASGCMIGRPKAPKANAEVTYFKDVLPIMQKQCMSCHREGQVAPFALTDYESTRDWGEMIGEVVKEKRMPPWNANPKFGHFANARVLTDQEIKLITRWVDAGAPRGTESTTGTKVEFATDWQLPRQPDLELQINAKPFVVPASGDIKYQYFRVDPQLTEDRWVAAAELVPGNYQVVHHILAFIRPKGSNDRLNAERGFFTGYVPGLRVEPWPKGYAKKLPANSEFIFQVHYTSNGSVQKDQSRLGLIFCDESEVQHEVITESAVQTNFRIPPHEAAFPVNAKTTPRHDGPVTLLAMAPHMHLRGKSFRYELQTPDGRRDILLDVPKYDFNWQHTYSLAAPLDIPKGSQIICSATFDNSKGNPHNPDPSKTVTWGDQTYEEMMIGYYHISVPMDASRKRDHAAGKAKRLSSAQEDILQRLDKNGDGELTRAEVPARYHKIFEGLDKNQDGSLNVEELSQLP